MTYKMLKLLPGVTIFVVVLTGISCETVVVLEHEEATLKCDISPTAPRSSAVFWYSTSILEYLTTDWDLILELRDAAPSLYQRLSVVGSPRLRGKYYLRITDVRAEDAGDYVCGYYHNGEWFTVKTVPVQVLTPPGREFPACSAQSPGGMLLLPGMLVNLSCISYGGSPRADLTWYRGGVPIQSTAAHDGLWVYHQRVIQEDDSGVEFTCKATSTALVEPKNCSITPYRRAPLLYIKHARGGLVELGDSAIFTCASKGVLIPGVGDEARYQWYLNGEPAGEVRSRIATADDGRSLTLNITSGDDKAVVSCEKVDAFTARSSASMTISVVAPDSFVTTPAPLVNVSRVDFVIYIVGAFCFGMIFMLFLIIVLPLLCNYIRKRGRLEFNTEHDIAVGWQKSFRNSRDGERRKNIAIVGRPVPKTTLLTFKKPNGVVANGNIPTDECAECLRSSNTEGGDVTDSTAPQPVVSSERAASRLSRQSRNATSHDLLRAPTTRKKPPPLTLFNETRSPLLSSPSPTRAGRRLPSVDRDYTASMPDLASRYFTEPSEHDYVNLRAPSSREESGSSTSSSYVNCEFVSPIPPATPVRKQSLRPSFSSNQKSLSYAELELPCVGDGPSKPLTPSGSPGSVKTRAGSVSVERTKYAQIAYVFKDRRQQSLPSVKLVGLSKGFGDNV